MHAGDIHGEDLRVFSESERKRVYAALHELMASSPLRTTQQCQHLLQYIVDHTLTGEDALLRERVIGKEVFGRKPDYEPGEDPVVRIRAADLRKRLALYYQSIQATPEVRIDVPSGSYRAVFTWKTEDTAVATNGILSVFEQRSETTSAEPEAESDETSLKLSEILAVAPTPPLPLIPAASPDPSVLSRRRWLWFAVLVLLAGAWSGFNWYRGGSDRMLRTFWAPVLDSSKPVLISIGSNAVYRVSDDKADEYSRQNHVENSGMEVFPKFDPGQSLASTGLYPAGDSFVALGDVASVAETVSMLAHFTKSFQERFPNDISFAEVRNNPTVLIGGFNNPMTRELTRNFRFVLASRNRIEDRNQPGKAWVLHASSDSHDTEDYAIVTRVLRHEEDEPLVSVAGMGQYGTLAAINFVCKPESLQKLGASLGKDWQRHNFQIVLRIKIIDFKPVSTSIIATHTW